MTDKKEILEKHKHLIEKLREYAPFDFKKEERTCYFLGANVALVEVGFDYNERLIVLEAAEALNDEIADEDEV